LNGAIPWFSLQWARDKKMLDIHPKILIQNTRNERLKPRIVATIDDKGVYGSQGMNFAVPKSQEYSVYFLISVINSSVINYLFATKFLNLAIKADYIKQISFPKPNRTQIEAIEQISREILEIKRRNINDDISSKQKTVNNHIYQLYNLSADEIEIIEKFS
jgi:hypothetical protein